VTGPMLGTNLSKATGATHWLFLAPINAERASYSPLLVLIGLAALTGLAWLAVRRSTMAASGARHRGTAATRCSTRACRTPPRASASRVRQVFEPFLPHDARAASAFDAVPRYRVTVEDHLWYWCYLPVAPTRQPAHRLVTLLQRGRISVYLLYSFGTLLVLLFLVR